jgi:hypothetical protein
METLELVGLAAVVLLPLLFVVRDLFMAGVDEECGDQRPHPRK